MIDLIRKIKFKVASGHDLFGPVNRCSGIGNNFFFQNKQGTSGWNIQKQRFFRGSGTGLQTELYKTIIFRICTGMLFDCCIKGTIFKILVQQECILPVRKMYVFYDHRLIIGIANTLDIDNIIPFFEIQCTDVVQRCFLAANP